MCEVCCGIVRYDTFLCDGVLGMSLSDVNSVDLRKNYNCESICQECFH